MKTLGIAAHSAEGGALCFITACREGAAVLGQHMHPPIVVSAVPMGLSMPGWESGDHEAVGGFLSEGVRQVADAGADFYISLTWSAARSPPTAGCAWAFSVPSGR